MTNDSYETLQKPLWVPRSVEETMQIYADWADTYEADVTNAGYATPDRIAQALVNFVQHDAKILDFGCGTGLSGQALVKKGFNNIDGVDISPQMLDIAHARDLYKTLWLGQPGDMTDIATGTYSAIVAIGVVSLGAAPAETLETLLSKLEPGGILAFSFNDPTLEDGSYDVVLDRCITSKTCKILFREHGDHLPGKGMGSDVIIVERT